LCGDALKVAALKGCYSNEQNTKLFTDWKFKNMFQITPQEIHSTACFDESMDVMKTDQIFLYVFVSSMLKVGTLMGRCYG
jgi:hypothetical protein